MERYSGDEEEEGEEEGFKGKSLVVVTPPSKKDEGTTKKLVVTPLSPPPPTKQRTRATANVEKSTKQEKVETTKSSRSRKKREISQAPTSQPKRRRLVKGLATRRNKTIDEVCVNLTSSGGLSSFRFVKYDTLDNDDRTKVEEAMIDMMESKKLAPNEVEKNIPMDMYNRLDKMWQHAVEEEKNVRCGTLAKVMPDVSQE